MVQAGCRGEGQAQAALSAPGSRQDPARGLLASAGYAPGMATDPRGEGHRRSREEGLEKRAVQSVEGDGLAPLAKGRGLKEETEMPSESNMFLGRLVYCNIPLPAQRCRSG